MPTYQTSRQSEDLPSQQQQSIASSFGAFATTHYKNYRIPLLVVFVLLVACIVVLAALFDDPWTVTWTFLVVISCVGLLGLLSTTIEMLCVEWIVPWLLQLQVSGDMSDDLAGVTIVALGNSFPTVAIAMVTTLSGQFNLSFGIVLGSGLLSFGAIPPACYFAAASTRDNNRTTSISSSSHKQALKLRVWPVLRDTVGYVGALIALGSILAKDGNHVGAGSALALVGYYLSYVALAILVPTILEWGNNFEEEEADYDPHEHDPLLGSSMYDDHDIDNGYEKNPAGAFLNVPGAPRWAAAVYDDVDDDDDDYDETRGDSRERSKGRTGRNSEETVSRPPIAGAANNGGAESSTSSASSGPSTASASSVNHRRSALEFDHEVSDDDEDDVSGDFGGGSSNSSNSNGSSSGGSGSSSGNNTNHDNNESWSCLNSCCSASYQCVVEQSTAWILALPALWSQFRQLCLDSVRAAVAYSVPRPPSVKMKDYGSPIELIVLGIGASFGWLAILSQGLYYTTYLLCYLIPGLSSQAIGALLLAMAMTTPNFFLATSMAKAGLHQGAVSGVTSSQVLLLTLGLGLPWIVYVGFDQAFVKLAFDFSSVYAWVLLMTTSGVVAVAFTAACLGPRTCPDCFDGGIGSGFLGGYGGKSKGNAALAWPGSVLLLGVCSAGVILYLLMEILHAAGVVS